MTEEMREHNQEGHDTGGEESRIRSQDELRDYSHASGKPALAGLRNVPNLLLGERVTRE